MRSSKELDLFGVRFLEAQLETQVHPNTSINTAMGVDNSAAVDLQPLETEASAGRTKWSMWLLVSTDPQPLWQQLFNSIKETVLPDPITKHHRPKRLLFFLQSLFPVLKWGKSYKASMFKSDFLAGWRT